MTAFVAGLRARLVHDSLYAMVKDSLTQLGWFNPNRQHSPITFLATEHDDETEVSMNTLVLVDGSTNTVDLELGSMFAEKRWQFFIDFYGESRPLAIQMSHDIRDIMEGRITAIGRTGPTFKIYNYTIATPVQIGYCMIENVLLDRTHNAPKLYQKHWYSVAFTVVDEYDDDE